MSLHGIECAAGFLKIIHPDLEMVLHDPSRVGEWNKVVSLIQMSVRVQPGILQGLRMKSHRSHDRYRVCSNYLIHSKRDYSPEL